MRLHATVCAVLLAMGLWTAAGLVDTTTLLSFRDSSDAVTTSLTAVASVVVTVSVDLPSRSGGDVPPTVLSSRVFLPNVAASASEA